MSRQRTIVFALPVLIIVVGFVATRFVEKDDVTRQIAVFAAVVATGGFLVNYAKAAYDVWDKERERQKKDAEKQEQVRATPICRKSPVTGGGISVGIELYNGNTQVNLKRVALVLKVESSDVIEQVLVANEKIKYLAIGSARTPGYVDVSEERVKLEPKDDIQFFVRSADARFSGEELLKRAPTDVWIVVESFAGEVARVPGEQIQEAIRKQLGGA